MRMWWEEGGIWGEIAKNLFCRQMRAFFGDGPSHEEYEKDEHRRRGRGDPVDVEIGKRESLIIARLLERLERELLGHRGVAGLLKEKRMASPEQLLNGGIEDVEILIEAQGVELLAAFQNGLRDGGSDASPFVAQEGEQSHGGRAQFSGDAQKRRHVKRREEHGQSAD